MVAKSCVNRCIIGNTLIKTSRGQRKETTLRRTRHTQFLIVPWGKFCNIVESSYASDDNTLIIMFVAVIHIKLPVAHQGTVEHIIIHLLFHRHGNAMNTDLEGDGSLRGRPDITSIRTNASPRHTQKGRILSFFHRNTKNTICAIIGLDILKTDLIDVHILRTTLGQQSFRGVKVGLAGFCNGVLPKLGEILRHHRRGLQQLWREGCATGTLVILAPYMCNYIHTVETRMLHRTRQFQRTVF